MKTNLSKQGLGTLACRAGEGDYPMNAYVSPIYETSTFVFPDFAAGAAISIGEGAGYMYTRKSNPNLDLLAQKIAVLEAYDLLQSQPQQPAEALVAGRVFASGMAAVTSAILARVHNGETLISQYALYSVTFNFLRDFAPKYGLKVVWVEDPAPQHWEQAFRQHPEARLALVETPVNPTLALVDIAAVAEIAHRHNAWLLVDNTFCTPCCQRPFKFGADVVMHSTTKYLSGHSLIVGGAVASTQLDFVRNELQTCLDTLGAVPSPFDAWLTNIGLKTLEVRMQRHCENALRVAQFLEQHPKVARVYYPGLPSHPDYELARRQMEQFGGMIAFDLKGGLEAGAALMNHVRLCILTVSLGNVDTFIQHPASMTHAKVPPAERLKMGITDGLVRLSVGVENVEDILADLEQALAYC